MRSFARTCGHQSRGDETAKRDTYDRVIDRQYVGAPLREHRTGRGDEGPGGHLEDLDAGEYVVDTGRHASSLQL
jgi:hypothetical protein